MVKGLDKIILAYFVIYFIWGANFIAIFYAIQSIPPFTMAGARFFIAGLLLLGMAMVRGEELPALKETLPAIKQGFWMNVGGTGALVWSEQHIPSGLASIVVAAVPLWIVILDVDNWSKNFSSIPLIVGLVLGIGGVGLLTGLGSHAALDADFAMGLTVLIIGTLSWAYGSLYSKKLSTKISLIMILAFQMGSAGILLTIIGGLSGELSGFSIQTVMLSSWIGLWFQILFGSLLGYLCYLWLLKRRPPAEVASYSYVNPVIAVALGVFMANEIFTPIMITAMILILVAVFLVRYHRWVNKMIFNRMGTEKMQ